MKNFIFFIFKILAIFCILSFLLEYTYTYFYTEKTNFSKFQYFINQQNKHFDNVFYGSSRVMNHVNPKVMDSCLNTNNVNFGVMDAKPKDILTLLKLAKYFKIQSDSIFIQSDYYYNSADKSNFLYIDMLPYLHENSIIKDYYYDEPDYFFLAYLPFYKYSKNNSKLGIRDLLASLFRKNKFEETKGFVPLYGTGNAWQRELPTKIIKNNFYNHETLRFLKGTRSNYVFFVAPFRNDTKNLQYVSQLKMQYTSFWDFSNAIHDSNQFKNGYHLNAQGASEFSILLSNEIKKK